MLSVNHPTNQRKRSIIQANYNGDTEEEERVLLGGGREDVLIHSVSCEFTDNADGRRTAYDDVVGRRRNNGMILHHTTQMMRVLAMMMNS